ncbi:MAG: hypothetical protein E7388_02980 [Ruminococcaceae bacterium]|nr:hypothetical protein [Oscillospiraceae bacterium]
MESVHKNPKGKNDAGLLNKLAGLPQALFGKKIETEELIIGALIVMLLLNRRKGKEEPCSEKDEGLPPVFNSLKEFLEKLDDKDILTIMLLYIML